ncbi:MAG: Na/Pi cotransporter family protein, partial [Deltaproteobacteria bacterium]|nr:Na/Pi cotransporter family protein [Deltaproteobacteria bacterium]
MLKYIDPTLVKMTPMALHAARNEMGRMLGEVESMLGRVLMLVASPEKKLGKLADAIRKSEAMVDNLQVQITAYMVAVAQAGISDRQSKEITGIVNAVSDIERMGDHCESMLKLLQRRYDEKLDLGEQAIADATEIGEQVTRFLALLQENVGRQLNGEAGELMKRAQELEDSIDDLRRQMRIGHVDRLRKGTAVVDAGLIFIDMLTSFEKIGDH